MAAYDDLNDKRIFSVGILSVVVVIATALAVQVLYYWMVRFQESATARFSSYRRSDEVLEAQTNEIESYGVDEQTAAVTMPIGVAIERLVAKRSGQSMQLDLSAGSDAVATDAELMDDGGLAKENNFPGDDADADEPETAKPTNDKPEIDKPDAEKPDLKTPSEPLTEMAKENNNPSNAPETKSTVEPAAENKPDAEGKPDAEKAPEKTDNNDEKTDGKTETSTPVVEEKPSPESNDSPSDGDTPEPDSPKPDPPKTDPPKADPPNTDPPKQDDPAEEPDV